MSTNRPQGPSIPRIAWSDVSMHLAERLQHGSRLHSGEGGSRPEPRRFTMSTRLRLRTTAATTATMLMLAALMAGWSTAACARTTRTVVVAKAPPGPRIEVRTTSPGPNHVWVAGYWSWNGKRHVWVAGKWTKRPTPTSTWVSGHWKRQGRGWIWIPGHWRRR